MIETIYILFLVLFTPFFRWQQVMEARSFPMIFSTLLAAILMLFVGFRIPFDVVTGAAGLFAIWIVFSAIWNENKQSILETMNLVSYLFMFLVARVVPIEYVLWALFLPGVVFAVWTLVNRIKGKEHKIQGSPIFGNNNHNAAFHLIHLFVGLHLAYIGHWYVIPFVALIGWAIGVMRCKGAWIAAVVALLSVSIMMTKGYIWSQVAAVFAVIACVGMVLEFKTKWGSSVQRFLLCLAALEMVKQKPLCGWGLNMFRVMLPEVNLKLQEKPWVCKIAQKVGGFHLNSSHRVHNDHFEFMCEMGLIGYGLFLLIFANVPFLTCPLLAGGIIAYAVDMLFFFPLREAHTGVPFWVLLGALAGVASPPIPAFLPNDLTAILLMIIAAVGLQIFKKLYGVVMWDLGGREKDPEKQRGLLLRAIQADPYNGMYLAQGFFCNVGPQPDFALMCAIIGMSHYDGQKVKWGIMDQFARAVLRMNHLNIAQSFVEKALRLNPEFEQAKQLKEQLEAIPKEKRPTPKIEVRKNVGR